MKPVINEDIPDASVTAAVIHTQSGGGEGHENA